MSSIKGYEWKSIEDILKETPPLEAQDTIDEKYPGAWGLWCRWQWMVTLSGMIDDAVIVVHGPEGCQASGRVFHGIHFEENNILADEEREGYLKKLGFRIVRYNNLDILQNIDNVLRDLSRALSRQRQPRSNPPL